MRFFKRKNVERHPAFQYLWYFQVFLMVQFHLYVSQNSVWRYLFRDHFSIQLYLKLVMTIESESISIDSKKGLQLNETRVLFTRSMHQICCKILLEDFVIFNTI